MSDSKGFLHFLFFKKWHPVPSVGSTIALFSIIGVIFVALGIVITVINNQIQEVTIYKYDQKCSPVEYNKECSFTYKLDNMKAPIYFYYELENFYQNHRRYVKSKSSTQLSGEEISLSDAEKYCDPIIYNKDLEEWQQNVYVTEQNTQIIKERNPDDIASPCGLVAKSFFNDTYELSLSGKKIDLNQTGISWPNDKGKKYKRASDSESTQWIDPENEHFIVWMRTAGLPTFRKLWGRIEQDIEEGEYTFRILKQLQSLNVCWSQEYCALYIRTFWREESVSFNCLHCCWGNSVVDSFGILNQKNKSWTFIWLKK
ncbi:unnamed protein product (macronuclear) [Paramecium tetraurelia]|uniref:Uncharacterized protein n=1 Tax=Paramecium tetraurelia TaxID=5888 RepID=A0DIC8_PARTE|nr:uncharacterized protein GSPATT00017167001 [Paramecium tetraurelia]CAK82795.1 unnamed protein product [Paramecium tetraurelia]|eukprot:XP_001450192.1 hypothetical protein (macronuclear) [Paramecium tetraurelia strain d4-2]